MSRRRRWPPPYGAGMSTIPAPDQGAPPLVLHQVRAFAAVLHREAAALRDEVTRLNAYALSLEWESSSARACLDELGDLARRMTTFAEGHDELAALVIAHATQAEAAAAALVRSATTAGAGSFV